MALSSWLTRPNPLNTETKPSCLDVLSQQEGSAVFLVDDGDEVAALNLGGGADGDALDGAILSGGD